MYFTDIKYQIFNDTIYDKIVIYCQTDTFMSHLDVYNLLIVTFLLFLPVLTHLLPLKLFVYLRLIIGILYFCTSAHLTVLSLSNPALNLTFSLLPITSSHPHASASDLTFDFLVLYKNLIDIDIDAKLNVYGLVRLSCHI